KTCRIRPRRSISSVHAVEPAKTPVVTKKPDTTPAPSRRWAVDRWKAKKAPQLSEYLDEKELWEVLRMIESFPPIVFAEEAGHLADAAVGQVFLLQGGDCAESFEEFNANK
ncbi:phospho-2-dehydro-3-deoxyheptonate aldolase, partial [Musa troglodytarum]